MTDDNTTEREARYDRYERRDHEKNKGHDTMNRIPEMPNPAKYEYPEKDIDGREGMFCGDCNTVMYATEPMVAMIRYQPCPICGGWMFWITRDWQPKHYGG